jgi:hypothetical protein
VGREPREGIGDPFVAGCPDVHPEAAIMLHGWADVPALEGVGCRGAMDGWFVVHQDADAWGCQWRLFVVEEAMYVRIGGQLGVKTTGRFIGKSRATDKRPATKWFLNVRMARSAELRRWT